MLGFLLPSFSSSSSVLSSLPEAFFLTSSFFFNFSRFAGGFIFFRLVLYNGCSLYCSISTNFLARNRLLGVKLLGGIIFWALLPLLAFLEDFRDDVLTPKSMFFTSLIPPSLDSIVLNFIGWVLIDFLCKS